MLVLTLIIIVLLIAVLLLIGERWTQKRKIDMHEATIERLTKDLEYFEKYSEFVDPLGLNKKGFDSERAEQVFRNE